MAELPLVVVAVGTMVFAGMSGVANISMAWQEHKKNSQDGSESVKSGQSCSGVRSFFACCRCSGVQGDYMEKNFICLSLMYEDPFFLYKRPHLLHKRENEVSVQSRRKRWMARAIRGAGRVHLDWKPRVEVTNGQIIVGELNSYTNDSLSNHFIGANATYVRNGMLNMGRQSAFSKKDAEDHWATLQLESFTADAKDASPSIAVVNWSAQVITVYVKPRGKEEEVFYRNYEVHGASLALFENEFKGFVVYSGVIEAGKLTGTNSQIIVTKGDRKCPVESENSWSLMGFKTNPDVKLPSRLRSLGMKRAAVFGILESLYERPTLLDVTMIDGGKGCSKEIVKVRAPGGKVPKFKDDNVFSVFAFNARGYANEEVLVG